MAKNTRHYGDGTWLENNGQYRLFAWADLATGRKRIRGPWAATKQDARNAWFDLIESMSEDLGITDINITANMKIGEAAALVALRDSRGTVVYSRNSKLNYRSRANKIAQLLPRMTVKDAAHFKSAYALRKELEKPDPITGWTGYSPQVALTMWFFNETLDQAELCRAIRKNPLRDIPKIKYDELFSDATKRRYKPRKEMRFNQEEYDKIINYLPAGTRQRLHHGLARNKETTSKYVYVLRMFQLMASTGLRVGEACALQWKHVHIGDRAKKDFGYVVFEQQIDDETRPIQIKRPKKRDNSSQVEYIYLDWEANDMLRNHRSEWLEDSLLSGHSSEWKQTKIVTEWLERSNQRPIESDFPMEGIVFPSLRGTPARKTEVQTRLRTISKELGIWNKLRGTHGFRRKLATEMLAEMPMDFVAKHLRHKAGTDITAVYADVDDDLFKKAADESQKFWIEKRAD